MPKEKRNYRLSAEEIAGIVAAAMRSRRTRTDIIRAGLRTELQRTAQAAARSKEGLDENDPLYPFLRGLRQ